MTAPTRSPSGGTPNDRTFDYLLNAMEHASRHENPAAHGYAEARAEVMRYVRGLESVRDQVVTLGIAARAAKPAAAHPLPEPAR